MTNSSDLMELSKRPIVQPPNGTTPNFINPETRTDLSVTVTSTIMAISLLFYFNRVYVKLCLMKRVSCDDATLLIALLLGLTYYVACTWAAQKGQMARHLWDISQLQAQSADFLVPAYLIFVVPPIAMAFLKASFFLLYLKLFSSLRWARICSRLGLCAVGIIHTSFGIYAFVVASPYHWRWAPKSGTVGVPMAITGAIVDWYILIIPVIAISRLDGISRRRKIGAMLIFLTGAFACLCSAFSIYMRYMMCKTDDKTWQEVLVHIGVLCELFVGIICACAPATAYSFRNPNSIWYRAYHDLRTLGTNGDDTTPEVERSQGPSSAAAHSRSESEMLKSTDRKYARYFELTTSYRRSSNTTHLYAPLEAMLPAHLAPEKENGKGVAISSPSQHAPIQFPGG